MRRALGTAVFSGMLGVTLFGLFLTPVFFTVLDRLSHLRLWHASGLATVGAGLLDWLRLGPVRRAFARRPAPTPRVEPTTIETAKIEITLTEITTSEPVPSDRSFAVVATADETPNEAPTTLADVEHEPTKEHHDAVTPSVPT